GGPPPRRSGRLAGAARRPRARARRQRPRLRRPALRQPDLRRVCRRNRRAPGTRLALHRSHRGLRRPGRPSAARGGPHRPRPARRGRGPRHRCAGGHGDRSGARDPRPAGRSLRPRGARGVPRRALHAGRRVLLLAALLAGGCVRAQAGPPPEPGRFRDPDLVELTSLDPGIKLDVRYATDRNFVGRPVYSEARAFLQRPAAEALLRAHRSLRPRGYGALVFDGYRPWSVTKLFWDLTPRAKREFVADPRKGSKHNRGCAVDMSLYDLATGRE